MGVGAAARQILPAFDYPEDAGAALAYAADYADWRRRPEGELPPLPDLQPVAARRRLRCDGHAAGWLLVPSDVVAQVLADYGVPRLHGHVVRSPAQAAEYADERGGPVALHALNPDLGGEPGEGAVRLWLPDGNAAWQAYEEMAVTLGAAMGGAAVVRPMATDGTEMVIGLTQDRLFGPVVMLGFGGSTGDLMNDRAYRLLPLTDLDAERLITSLRCSPLLFGYRDRPRADAAG